MDDFTLADVYEHAAKIGQDIEHLIRDYGESSVEELMPKIVFTLEQLEGLADRRQKDVATINDLNGDKERLSIECKKETAYRRQAEEKIEYLENMMNDDTKSLQNKIKLLVEENDLLKSELQELDEEVLSQRTKALPGDVDLMVKMKTTIDVQRDQIREVNQENERHKSEIDALNEQTNRLTDMNERLRLYNQKLQDRLAKTIEHKLQAESTLASVKIANEDAKAGEKSVSEQGENELVATEEDGKESKEQVDGKNNDQENGYVVVPEPSKAVDEKNEENKGKEKEDTESGKEAGKNGREQQEVAKKDPNRPRYMLSEMQQVLDERNRYKERVSVLEDILEAYTSGPVRSSTLDKNDENLRKRHGQRGSKDPPKRESKVRGIFGSFWKGSA